MGEGYHGTSLSRTTTNIFMQLGLDTMTESQIFFHVAQPNSVNRTNARTNKKEPEK